MDRSVLIAVQITDNLLEHETENHHVGVNNDCKVEPL